LGHGAAVPNRCAPILRSLTTMILENSFIVNSRWVTAWILTPAHKLQVS